MYESTFNHQYLHSKPRGHVAIYLCMYHQNCPCMAYTHPESPRLHIGPYTEVYTGILTKWDPLVISWLTPQQLYNTQVVMDPYCDRPVTIQKMVVIDHKDI